MYMKIKHKDNFATISLSLLFLSLTLLAGFLGYQWFTKKDEVKTPAQVSAVVSPTQSPWQEYSNSEFSFSFSYPRLLIPKNARDSNGYVFLVIFGENSYTEAKGIAVGVGRRNIEEEIKMVKDEYGKDESAELVSEKDIEVASEKGRVLSYKPKGEDKSLESRDIVIVGHGDYIYTISTVPEQMENILETWKFL